MNQTINHRCTRIKTKDVTTENTEYTEILTTEIMENSEIFYFGNWELDII